MEHSIRFFHIFNDFHIIACLLSCQKTTYPHTCNTQQEELMYGSQVGHKHITTMPSDVIIITEHMLIICLFVHTYASVIPPL